MLNDSKDMPKIQIITDEKSIEKYGGNRMYSAKQNQADFTDPITAGISRFSLKNQPKPAFSLAEDTPFNPTVPALHSTWQRAFHSSPEDPHVCRLWKTIL